MADLGNWINGQHSRTSLRDWTIYCILWTHNERICMKWRSVSCTDFLCQENTLIISTRNILPLLKRLSVLWIYFPARFAYPFVCQSPLKRDLSWTARLFPGNSHQAKAIYSSSKKGRSRGDYIKLDEARSDWRNHNLTHWPLVVIQSL